MRSRSLVIQDLRMDVLGVQRAIALARFPDQIRGAARHFHRLTGLTAATTLGLASSENGLARRGIPPPVHPLCARLLRRNPRVTPCGEEWKEHLQSAEKTRECRVHSCPLGLRCAGIPIVAGGTLIGLAKFVSSPDTRAERFHSHVSLLALLIAQPCQELEILLLRAEVDRLTAAVDRLRRVKQLAPGLCAGGEDAGSDRTAMSALSGNGSYLPQTVIGQVLDYLNQHYTDCGLSLMQVARAVGRNEKYVAHLFVQQVGVRMRAYITMLRVQHGCELLLQTGRSITQVSIDSGFAHAVHFRESFRRRIGVSPSMYRQIFIP